MPGENPAYTRTSRAEDRTAVRLPGGKSGSVGEATGDRRLYLTAWFLRRRPLPTYFVENPVFRRARYARAAAISEAKPGLSASRGEDWRREGMSFASFRRFWAVAANRNSSLAPLGPRRRNRSSPRICFG
jgi:hypothetical protein